MAPRSSQQDQSGVVWQTVGVRLGQGGLDLRDQTDGTTLVKLINARFRDDRTVERRCGHVGIRLRDAGAYPIFRDALDNPVSSPITPNGWVYGHGQRLAPTNVLASENTHIPEPGQACGGFDYDGATVAWTGDRLLVVRTDGNPALGQSVFWDPTGSNELLSYGIPAYLPLQTDSVAPETIQAAYPETALTDDYRFTVGPKDQHVEAWVTNRETGATIDYSLLGVPGGGTAVDLRVFRSGPVVVVLWRVAGGGHLYMSWWSGTGWTTSTVGDSVVSAFDVAPVDGGFYLFWRTTTALKVGRFIGRTSANVPFTFGTTLTVTGGSPNGAVAVSQGPSGDLAFAWAAADGLYLKSYTANLTAVTQVTLDTGTSWTGGLTVAHRLLATAGTNKAPVVVHAGDAAANVVKIWERQGSGLIATKTDTRHNSRLASKSFVVGNEVFAWLRSVNASTLYLVAGSQMIRVCGYADREVAATRTITDSVGAISMVTQDPLDQYAFTWARPFVTGQDYVRPGNALIGDLQFLPKLSTAQYGKSVYLSGSAVRNWDGADLGHAGWQDYPVVQNAVTFSSGGFLTAGGKYRVMVVAVRYNNQGERFESPAVISAEQTVTAGNSKITWQVQPVPSTDHPDAVLEFWRSTDGGSVFYFEGTAANDLTADVVTFDSTISDTDIAKHDSESHASLSPGVVHVHEAYGPIGSEILTVVGDRLWTAGGQVPAGFAQYSMLKTINEGAGFDSEDGALQWIDTTGGRIRSIAELANGAVFFEDDKIQVVTDNGPDNYGNGSFAAPQLVLADGAITHAGTCAAQAGIPFWSAGGPRILDRGFSVQPIGLPVQLLAETMTPTGVRVDLGRQEVVWYTAEGTGLLWNYLGGSRWAEWTGLKVAGCTKSSLITPDGRVFFPKDDVGDDGAPFEFAGATGELRAETALGGATDIRGVGIAGQYLGPHNVRLRVFYNGSPMWTDEWTWQPADSTGLISGSDLADLTAADIDALGIEDFSGSYAMHERTSRGKCRTFRVEWSDVSSSGATMIPHEISLEVGALGGFGRVTPGTI